MCAAETSIKDDHYPLLFDWGDKKPATLDKRWQVYIFEIDLTLTTPFQRMDLPHLLVRQRRQGLRRQQRHP